MIFFVRTKFGRSVQLWVDQEIHDDIQVWAALDELGWGCLFHRKKPILRFVRSRTWNGWIVKNHEQVQQHIQNARTALRSREIDWEEWKFVFRAKGEFSRWRACWYELALKPRPRSSRLVVALAALPGVILIAGAQTLAQSALGFFFVVLGLLLSSQWCTIVESRTK